MYQRITVKEDMIKMKKLVVVADDPDIVEIMSDYLKIRGYKVVGTGHDSSDAVILYQSLRPDAIILDFDKLDSEWERMIDTIKEYDHDGKIIVFGSVHEKF